LKAVNQDGTEALQNGGRFCSLLLSEVAAASTIGSIQGLPHRYAWYLPSTCGDLDTRAAGAWFNGDLSSLRRLWRRPQAVAQCVEDAAYAKQPGR